MNDRQFNDFCCALEATAYVIRWHNSDVWKAGGKVFAIGGLGVDDKPAFIFKISEPNFGSRGQGC